MKVYYSNNISWQILNNTIYIIDEITSKIYSLNDVAKDIWLLIKDNDSINVITKILSERYCVPKDMLIYDINEFKNSLVVQNLLKEGDSSYE